MTKSEFVRKMESAKKAYDKAREKEEQIFNELAKQFPRIDLEDCVSNAENADNVKDAITCYLQYGEYVPEMIWDEIIMAEIARSQVMKCCFYGGNEV